MREGSPFTLYAHQRVLAILKSNSIFNVLNEKNVKRQPIEVDTGVRTRSARRLAVRHRGAALRGSRQGRVVSRKARRIRRAATARAIRSGFGSCDKASGKYFYFLAACARVTDDLKSRLAGAPLVFFDGTVWRDDELIAAGLGNKTGQGMGHISMSGDHGAIESLAGLDIGRKMFLHINNSNPALAARLGRAQDRRDRRAGKSPPTERRSRCERHAPSPE
mgnify:CR=1 FL=1